MKYKVVIIRGPLGVGKTSVSDTLCKILGMHHIAIDQVLRQNKLDASGDISLDTFLKANRIIMPLVKNYLKQNIAVVIDHNFYYKEQLVDLINRFDDVLVITLKASLATCLKRDLSRQKAHGQEATKAVYTLVAKFDYGHIIETDKKDAHAVAAEILDLLGV